MEGIEPPSSVLETDVLPLNYKPIILAEVKGLEPLRHLTDLTR